MFDFTKLWDKIYLLGPNPLAMSRSDWAFLYFACGGLLLGALAKTLAYKSPPGSPQKNLWNRFFHLFATTGVLMIFWAAMRFENIPWLGTHILVLGIILTGAVWFGFIARYYLTGFKKQKQAWDQDQIKRKYLR